MDDLAMHDWTLSSVLFEWRSQRVTLALRNHPTGEVQLIAEQVIDLHIPHRKEWGHSVHVNETLGPMDAKNGLKRFEIEMQSGNVIKIVAASFELQTGKGP